MRHRGTSCTWARTSSCPRPWLLKLTVVCTSPQLASVEGILQVELGVLSVPDGDLSDSGDAVGKTEKKTHAHNSR